MKSSVGHGWPSAERDRDVASGRSAAPQIQSMLAVVEEVYSIQPPLRYTMDGEGLFLPSRLSDIQEALSAADLKPGERFLDLGSGDGRVVCMAAAMGALSCGIESDAALDRAARAQAAEIRQVIEFPTIDLIRGDFLNFPFGEADVIFYYGGGNTRRQEEIYGKLEREMRPQSRLIVFRTAREPHLALPRSSSSRPPHFYIFYK